MRLTTLPFLLAMVMALAQMPTDVYQICAWGHGTEETEPWRSTLSTLPAVQQLRAMGTRVRDWFADLADTYHGSRFASEVGAVVIGSLKQLIQSDTENKAASAKLKKEGRALQAIPVTAIAATATTPEVKARTADQVARLTAIGTELDALEEQAETIAAELKLARRLQEDERAAGARIEPGVDLASQKVWGPTLHSDATPQMKADAQLAALGEFAIAVKNQMSGSGSDPRLFAAASGMSTANGPDGGFAVPVEIAAGIEREMYENGELLGLVDARTISGDAITYVVVNETSRADGSRQGGVRHYWVDQGTPPTASQTDLARVELKLRKVGTLGYVTDELVADAAALGGELRAMFVEELIFGVEDAITEGDGAKKPLGYLGCPCQVSVAKTAGQSAGTITTENLSRMWSRMRARDKKTAVWLINGDCGPQLDLLSIPAGAGALEPRFVNYGPTGILTIKGRPVIETEYNATLGTVGDIVLINPKRYRLIRKGGVEQASSIHVRFTQGEETIRSFYRVDGQMLPRAPLTPFKGGANTLSPVVVLATRS